MEKEARSHPSEEEAQADKQNSEKEGWTCGEIKSEVDAQWLGSGPLDTKSPSRWYYYRWKTDHLEPCPKCGGELEVADGIGGIIAHPGAVPRRVAICKGCGVRVNIDAESP